MGATRDDDWDERFDWRPLLIGVALATLIIVVAFAIWYAVIAIPYFTGKPVIGRDYVAEFNAQVEKIPEGDRAWPLYREAAMAMPTEVVDMQINFPEVWPGSERWGEASGAVDRIQGAILLARAGASRSSKGFLLESAQDRDVWVHVVRPENRRTHGAGASIRLIDVSLVDLSTIRVLHDWTLTHALRAGAAGDGDEALADLIAAIGMASHLGEGSPLVSQLFSWSQLQRVCQVATLMADQWPMLWSDAQLGELARGLLSYSGGVIRCDFAFERMGFEDVVQRVHTDDGNGDGRVGAEGMGRAGAWNRGARRRPVRLGGADRGAGTRFTPGGAREI